MPIEACPIVGVINAFCILISVCNADCDVKAIVNQTGQEYRQTAEKFAGATNMLPELQHCLNRFPPESDEAAQINILMGRITHPWIFEEWQELLRNCRSDPKCGEPGSLLLLSRMLEFVRKGPESRFVQVFEGWEPATVATNMAIVFRRPKRVSVEKFSEKEVSLGKARNSAARMAVLEQILKFYDEGDALEQCEMVALANRLWGNWASRGQHSPYALQDHVYDIKNLADYIFRNPNRPLEVRVEAASYLAERSPQLVCDLMMTVITNSLDSIPEYRRYTLTDKALYHLYWYGDKDVLSELSAQTNGPVWKVEKINSVIPYIRERSHGKLNGGAE